MTLKWAASHGLEPGLDPIPPGGPPVTRTLGRHRQRPAGASPPSSQSPSLSPPPSSDLDRGPVPADAELLAAVRGGDTGAYGVLYDRHREAARRLARVLVRDPSDAEDLVAEAVAKVLAALRAGRGPEVAFRAYLLTAVRNACYDRARRDRRIELTEDLSRYESAEGARGGGEAGDPAVARLERSYAARAFAKLPERWRTVLWHTEVEGEKPAAIAVMLGLSPNAVAALAYRARERLRQIYLQEHLSSTANPACHWTADRLGAHVRGGLARREQSKVDSHLAGCADCRVLWTELAEVNSGLRGVLGPLVLGAAAPPYLAALPQITWWGVVAGWSQQLVGLVRGWWSALVRWGREQVERYGPGNVAAGAGVALAALVGVGLFVLALALVPGGGPDEPEQPPAAGPGPPVPAPAPPPTEEEPPTRPSEDPGAGTPDELPAAVPEPARPSSPAPAEPVPPAPEPIAVAPDLSATSLAAGAPGELAIEVLLPAARSPESGTAAPAPSPTPAPAPPTRSAVSIMEFRHDTPGDTPTKLHDRRDLVELVVGWPAGMALAGADAGDGWRCTAAGPGASCQRPVWRGGEARVARLPVTVADSLGGFAPVDLTVTAGDRLRGRSGVRVPVAPPGQRVGFAATGRYRLAMAGNTWLSCQPRPDCLRADPLDNDLVPMVPYLPAGGGEPTPPGGLGGGGAAVAASGAELAVPAGAKVAWAALHWATTAAAGPEPVRVHTPGGGGWREVTADRVQPGGDMLLRQAYADVTGLVRDGRSGAWWLAAAGSELPTGRGVSAGWSLTVVYAHPDAPRRDVAVFTDPVSLTKHRPRSVTTDASGSEVEVGLVVWEGDRRLTGDSLRLDGKPLGDPDNLAAGRAAGALECGETPVPECGWHTFGVDVARYQGSAGAGPDRGAVTLRTRSDGLEVGVVALAVQPPR
ncbi:MAG: sigma-70 family RNA polymerase sigma factor [Micromonosporaceae bacterium]|nr:sigma-70 family RNA polymerase sigma factor [Micromonosporaceae bacterium]